MKEEKKVKKVVKKSAKKKDISVEEINELALEAYDDVIPDVKEIFMFGAKWCGPCRQMKQYLGVDGVHDASKLPNDIAFTFYDVDTGKGRDLAKKYAVRNVPTFVHIKNGDVLEGRIVGITTVEKLTEKFN
jgi:thiol-disulfide isomerase/thioredoxin